MLLLAAGIELGFADGNEFDEVGCSVAQQPEGGKAERLKAERLKAEDDPEEQKVESRKQKWGLKAEG